MIKGIIFDLDGTTLYTLPDMHASVNKTLKEFKYKEKTIEEIKNTIGHGSKNLIKVNLPKGTSEEVVNKVLSRYKEIYYNNAANKTVAYEGMNKLVDKLEEKGILLSVNSNKFDDLTKQLVKKYYPGNKFISIIGSRDGIPNKPDPYSSNEIINIMGLDKSEVAYIGDSEADYETANNAGLKFIGCAWGLRGAEVLKNIGVKNIAYKPEDILKYID